MDINQKREKIKKWATVGLIGLVGLVVSPVIFLAIQGLIGLVIAGVIGLTVVTFAPWASMKFANWKVASIAAEAKENPIETMTNLLIAKRSAFQEFKNTVENAITATKNFETKVAEFSKKYPARAVEFKTQLTNMQNLVKQKVEALKAADRQLDLGEEKLKEMRAYWDMSQAAIEANKAAGMDTGDIYEKMKADVAVDSVFDSMNRAFAQLEVAAALDVTSDDKQDDQTVKLGHSDPNVLDVSVRESQKVG